MDELIDILDSEGKFTGTSCLKSIAHKEGLYHATTHVWFYTDDEKIKRMIAKCLLLLANDDETGEVGQTFNRLSDLIDT